MQKYAGQRCRLTSCSGGCTATGRAARPTRAAAASPPLPPRLPCSRLRSLPPGTRRRSSSQPQKAAWGAGWKRRPARTAAADLRESVVGLGPSRSSAEAMYRCRRTRVAGLLAGWLVRLQQLRHQPSWQWQHVEAPLAALSCRGCSLAPRGGGASAGSSVGSGRVRRGELVRVRMGTCSGYCSCDAGVAGPR